MADLLIQICDFKTPSKSAHKLIDKESMRTVINSEKFKENLSKGKILGLVTHKDRYNLNDQNIPFSDNVLVSPYLANVCRKIWIDDSNDTLMGEFDLLDTPYGRLMKDMYKKGIYTNVSMSVQATLSPDGNKYVITDFLGTDFTQSNDLKAGVVSVSFSEQRLGAKRVYNFSQPQTKDTVKINFNLSEPLTSDPNLLNSVLKDFDFSESTSTTPTPTDLQGDDVKLNVEAAKPVPNTAVPTETPVITNLDVGNVAGVDVHSITPENPALIKLIKTEKIYKVSTPEQFSVTTKLFDSMNEEYEVIADSLSDTADNIADNKGLTSDSVNDKSVIDLFSDVNDTVPELDTNDMEKIHESIPIEDQLTEQELTRLPSEITSQVNASQRGIVSALDNGTYFSVTGFNGKSEKISKKLFARRITNNFSEELIIGKEFSNNKGKRIYIDSCNNGVYNVFCNNGKTYKVFSSNLKKLLSTKYTNLCNFTVQSYLQELNMQPYQVLRRRINEVIQLCRGWKQDKITNNLATLKAYFDSYILTWITRIINNPNEEFNIILGLRLQNFRVDQKKMRDFNRCIKRMRSQMNSTGFMNRQIQTELNTYFQAIENDIYEYINGELARSGKYFR